MSVLKTLFLIFLNKRWRKSTGSQVPSYQDPFSDLKPIHTSNLGVHGEDPEGSGGEEGGRGDRDGEYM